MYGLPEMEVTPIKMSSSIVMFTLKYTYSSIGAVPNRGSPDRIKYIKI